MDEADPSPGDEMPSPPSWEHLDDLGDEGNDVDMRLSQALECISRSPARLNTVQASRGEQPSSGVEIDRVDKATDKIISWKESNVEDEKDRFVVESVDHDKSQDQVFYDGGNTLSDRSTTRMLWRQRDSATGERSTATEPDLPARTPSDRESVYDTVSSTSSSAPLLRKITQDFADPTSSYKSIAQPDNIVSNSGRNFLAKTLEQVKKSLEDLGPPSPEAELFSQVMGTPSVCKISRVYLKNLIILSLCFMLLYTAFFSLRNLQSSINQEGGLGLAGLSCISASFIVFCLTAPSVVQNIRPKYALVLSMISHLLFELANFYPSFYTIIPASVILGCSMSCLWVAQGTYLTSLAVTYATVTGKRHDAIIGLFNGIFLFCLQLAQIVGNLMSSFVFNFPLWNKHDNVTLEYSPLPSRGLVPVLSSLQDGYSCGAQYCHFNMIRQDNLSVSVNTVHILLGTFIALTILAIGILAIWLDKLDVIFHRNKSTVKQQLLTLTNIHRDHKIWLMAMLLIFLGMEQAYMFGEVTKAFVTCPLGVHMIGYVMVCFGACDSLMSFFCGQVQKVAGTRLLITLGAALHLGLLISALLWRPELSPVWLIFVFAGGLGVTDAIWQTQICSLIGCMYPHDRESAFASLRMYEGIGYTVAFAYSQSLCMDVKTYILIGVLVVGIGNYYVMEHLHNKERRARGTYPPVDV